MTEIAYQSEHQLDQYELRELRAIKMKFTEFGALLISEFLIYHD